MWWLIPVSLVAVLVAVLIGRTLAFRPRAAVAPLEGEEVFDRERAIERLQELVRCRTVSRPRRDLEDEAEFEKLIGLLPVLYPQVHRVCRRKELPERALLYRWEGKRADAPCVLMAHYDVVPVEEDGWDKPAFEAIIEDGVMWGRGTLDTKVTVNAILSAAEELIGQGFVPEQDIYFAFSGGEEVNGEGAIRIVDELEASGITPALVLDEGGAVVENVFPGVKDACGMIGIAEKGLLDACYRVTSKGGHASAPKPNMPIDRLARACCRVLEKPFAFHITAPVAAMFDTLGRHSTFLYRMIFANLWLFSPVLDGICRKGGGELNALMRTTVAFTCMNGSKASNVIPPTAEMISNIRLNPCDTVESALAQLRRTVGDEQVQITALGGMDPSRISRIDTEGYARVARAVASTWRGCIVSPYLMVQCSDSRHYGRISDRVYRFSAMDLTSEERATIHGNNERIRLETAERAVEFYLRLMRQC